MIERHHYRSPRATHFQCAEFVENSIDAKAKNITIIRG